MLIAITQMLITLEKHLEKIQKKQKAFTTTFSRRHAYQDKCLCRYLPQTHSTKPKEKNVTCQGHHTYRGIMKSGKHLTATTFHP